MIPHDDRSRRPWGRGSSKNECEANTGGFHLNRQIYKRKITAGLPENENDVERFKAQELKGIPRLHGYQRQTQIQDELIQLT